VRPGAARTPVGRCCVRARLSHNAAARGGRRLQLQGLASFVADAARRAAPGAQGDEWAAAARLVRDVAEQLERANDGLARIEDMATALMLHAATAVKTEGHDAGLAEPPLLALCGQVDALDERLREACDAARRGTLEARSQQTYYALKCRSLTVALDAARADGLARSALQHQLHDAYARLEHLEQMRQHAHGHDGSDGGARELDERDLELTQMALQVERLQRENETLREQRESVEQVGGGQAARLLEVCRVGMQSSELHVALNALSPPTVTRCKK